MTSQSTIVKLKQVVAFISRAQIFRSKSQTGVFIAPTASGWIR